MPRRVPGMVADTLTSLRLGVPRGGAQSQFRVDVVDAPDLGSAAQHEVSPLVHGAEVGRLQTQLDSGLGAGEEGVRGTHLQVLRLRLVQLREREETPLSHWKRFPVAPTDSPLGCSA